MTSTTAPVDRTGTNDGSSILYICWGLLTAGVAGVATFYLFWQFQFHSRGLETSAEFAVMLLALWVLFLFSIAFIGSLGHDRMIIHRPLHPKGWVWAGYGSLVAIVCIGILIVAQQTQYEVVSAPPAMYHSPIRAAVMLAGLASIGWLYTNDFDGYKVAKRQGTTN